jgi:O-antigen/teichoic acid export membrane protein
VSSSVSLKARALRGVLWNLVEVLGTQGTAFLVFVLLARLLQPASFGLVALAGSVIMVLQIFVEAGFSTAIVRAEEVTEQKLNTAFWIGVGVALLLVLALSLSASVAALYGTPGLAPVLRALAWIMLFSSLSAVHTALLVRKLDFRSKALRRLVAVIAGGIAGVTMALLDYGVWALVGKQAVEGLVDCLAVAYRANVAVTEIALRATSRTAIPVFAKLQGEPDRLRDGYYAALELAALVACPIFLGLSATAPEVCLTMFGAEWAESVRPMQVLGLAGLGAAINLYLGPILIAVGQPTAFFRFSLAQGILNVIAFGIAVHWGIVAVAWAFVARSLVTLPAVIWLMRRAIGADARRILGLVSAPVAASLAVLGTIAAARPALAGLPTIVSLGVLIVVGALTYLALMAVLGRRTVERFLVMLRSARSMRAAGT